MIWYYILLHSIICSYILLHSIICYDTLLQESGLWRVESAAGFVLFPGSDHIETVVILDRAGGKSRKPLDHIETVVTPDRAGSKNRKI